MPISEGSINWSMQNCEAFGIPGCDGACHGHDQPRYGVTMFCSSLLRGPEEEKRRRDDENRRISKHLRRNSNSQFAREPAGRRLDD